MGPSHAASPEHALASSLELAEETDRLASLAKFHAEAVRFSRIDIGSGAWSRAVYNRVVAGVHRLMASADELLADGVPRAAIREAAGPARRAMATSPFAARVQTWPRGYPGDFETIEYLVDGINRATPGTLGFYCEQFFLHTPPATQHREKLRAQSERYRLCLVENPRARILVLAIGGGRDILPVLDELVDSRAEIVVNDMDPDALVLCAQRFSCLDGRYEALPGNAVRLLPTLRAKGPFDLVVAGGLFDYVPQPVLRRLVPRIVDDLLRPGGRLFFTNIAAGNPYRSWMEIFASWELVERSAADIEELVGPSRDRCASTIQRDISGLTWLVDVIRND